MSRRDSDADLQSRATDAHLQGALEALRDPVRRSMLRQLAATPDWTLTCGAFDVPVCKATTSHHLAVLRDIGLIEQREEGTRVLNRLARDEFDRCFPGLLDLILASEPT